MSGKNSPTYFYHLLGLTMYFFLHIPHEAIIPAVTADAPNAQSANGKMSLHERVAGSLF